MFMSEYNKKKLKIKLTKTKQTKKTHKTFIRIGGISRIKQFDVIESIFRPIKLNMGLSNTEHVLNLQILLSAVRFENQTSNANTP